MAQLLDPLLLFNIAPYLDLETLASCRCASQHWSALLQNNALWVNAVESSSRRCGRALAMGAVEALLCGEYQRAHRLCRASDRRRMLVVGENDASAVPNARPLQCTQQPCLRTHFLLINDSDRDLWCHFVGTDNGGDGIITVRDGDRVHTHPHAYSKLLSREESVRYHAGAPHDDAQHGWDQARPSTSHAAADQLHVLSHRIACAGTLALR